jgi:general secretion pathway protein N
VKNVWRYIAIGVAAYFLILLATYPATRAVPLLEQQVEGLDLRAVTGSVISGHAGQMLWQGEDLGAVDWQLRPLRLLLGAAEYRLDLQNAQASGSTRLGITLLGTVYGRELDMKLAPESIINRFSPVPVSAGGELTMRFDRFVPAGKIPSGVQGALVWQAAVIREPVQIPLGDLELSLNSVDDALVATLTNGGALGASGDITLSDKGRYAVDVVLQPGTAVNSEILGMLEMAARKQPGGKYRLNTSGSLW